MLDKHYDAVYKNEEAIFNKIQSGYPLNRTEAVISICPEGNRCLEIGFGNGNLLYNLKDNFSELYGIEFSSERFKQAQKAFDNAGKMVHLSTGNIETCLDYPDGYFDVIIWADVIEHIVNIWAAMKEINRLLKTGGTLITTTPNVGEIRRRLTLLSGKFPSTSGTNEGLDVRDGELFDGGHVHYFTYRSLSNLYRKFNLNPHKILGFGKLGLLHNIYPSLLSSTICISGVKLGDVSASVAAKL